jgi:hypothetical protein
VNTTEENDIRMPVALHAVTDYVVVRQSSSSRSRGRANATASSKVPVPECEYHTVGCRVSGVGCGCCGRGATAAAQAKHICRSLRLGKPDVLGCTGRVSSEQREELEELTEMYVEETPLGASAWWSGAGLGPLRWLRLAAFPIPTFGCFINEVTIVR